MNKAKGISLSLTALCGPAASGASHSANFSRGLETMQIRLRTFIERDMPSAFGEVK